MNCKNFLREEVKKAHIKKILSLIDAGWGRGTVESGYKVKGDKYDRRREAGKNSRCW